jgi:hypothetical protein
LATKQPTPPEQKKHLALNLREEMESRFSLRNSQMREIRKRRYLEHSVAIPEQYQATANEVRLSLIADTINLKAAIIDDAPWRVHVDPYDVGPRAERNSSLRERWSEAAFRQAQEELGRAVLTNVTQNQMGDGVGVLKVIYRPDHWTTLPTVKSMFGKSVVDLSDEEASEYDRVVEKAKRGMKLPFTLVDVDPITWHPLYGPDGDLNCVIEIREHPIHDALLQYGDRIAIQNNRVIPVEAMGEPQPYDGFHDGDDPRGMVKVWEYWDRDEHITFVEDVPVKYAKHGMGQVPYFECYAQPSADRDPARNSRPPEWKQQWVCDLIDSFWSMLSNAAYMWAYPTPKLITDPNAAVPVGDDGKPEFVEIETGKLWRGYVGQDISFLTTPVDSFRYMGDLLDRAQRMFETSTGLGPAIRGLGGSDQPGYAINQLISASMFTLNPALKSRDHMIAKAILYMWRLIERRVKGDVWVWGTDPSGETSSSKKWLKLGPADIDGYYRCTVTSEAMTDIRQVQIGQFWASMVKAEMMDRRGGMERMGIENPDDVIDSIEVDKMLSSGPLADAMREQILKRRNMLPKQQGGPDGGPGGGPPGPPMGPPPGPDMGGGMPGLPGLPPAPGQGMPLEPPPPPDQGLPQTQIENMAGMSMPGGRPAGFPRLPPTPQGPPPTGPQGPS